MRELFGYLETISSTKYMGLIYWSDIKRLFVSKEASDINFMDNLRGLFEKFGINQKKDIYLNYQRFTAGMILLRGELS